MRVYDLMRLAKDALPFLGLTGGRYLRLSIQRALKSGGKKEEESVRCKGVDIIAVMSPNPASQTSSNHSP